VPPEAAPPPKKNNTADETEAIRIKLEVINELGDLAQLEKEIAEKRDDRKKIDEIKNKKSDLYTHISKLLDYAGDDIKVAENSVQQNILKGIREQGAEADELINLFSYLGDYLLGTKNIILMSTDSAQKSDFELKLINLMEVDARPALIVADELYKNAHLFGLAQKNIQERFGNLFKKFGESDRNSIEGQIKEYFSDFTESKKDFIRHLFDTESFLDLITTRYGDELRKETSNLENELKEAYKKQHGVEPDSEWLETLLERQIYIKVSEGIGADISDILRNIYRQIAIQKGHADFHTVQGDDFMHGIMVTKNIISRALHGLESNFKMREEDNQGHIDPRLLRMYKLTQEESYTAELNIDGNINPKPMTKPLPYFKNIRMSEFITGQWSNFFHWEHATGYFHDIGLVFKSPPREGFWAGVKQFASQMTSVDIDGFYSLPEGPMTIEAYHLLEKFTQEAYAKIDWKIQADMDTIELEGINTQIQNKVIEYLKLNHKGEKISETAYNSAVNNASGIASGIYLSATENTAYADAENATQSYSTLDATPEVVFNMMHFFMRWGGPALLNQVFFMEADGVKQNFLKSLFGIGGWDHNVAMKNAKAVMDSFTKLKKGTGRESEMMNLIIDKFLHFTKTGDFLNRGGWRNKYTLTPHFLYDDQGKLKLLDSFRSMDVIGFEAANWFLRNIDNKNAVNLSGDGFLEKITGDGAAQREALFKDLYERYFKQFSSGKSYEDYIKSLEPRAVELVIKNVKDNHNMPFDDYKKAVQKKISDLFIEGAITRYVAARFPTKFFRIDKGRYHFDGVGLHRQMYDQMKKKYSSLTIDQFSSIMNDLEFVEGVIRQQVSKKVKEHIHLLRLDDVKNRSLSDHIGLLQNLDENKIREILVLKDLDEDRIKKAVDLYDLIYKKMIGKSEKKHDKEGKLIKIDDDKILDFLDGEAIETIKKFPFNLGIDDTDFSLVVYRAAGPNMLVRSIGDIASMEDVVIKGFLGIPEMFKQISITGDYSPFIKYLKECQKVFHDVHGVPADYEFNDKLLGMLANYMRGDDNAVPGRLNSAAAEAVNDSKLVRLWDGRDIDGLYLVAQQEGLLPKYAYDTTFGPKYEKVWKLDRKGNPVPTKKQKIVEEYEHTTEKARKKHGGDWKNILITYLKKILPLAMIWLAWQYLKKAFEETFGAKKG